MIRMDWLNRAGLRAARELLGMLFVLERRRPWPCVFVECRRCRAPFNPLTVPGGSQHCAPCRRRARLTVGCAPCFPCSCPAKVEPVRIAA